MQSVGLYRSTVKLIGGCLFLEQTPPDSGMYEYSFHTSAVVQDNVQKTKRNIYREKKLSNADCITNAILWTADELATKGIVMKYLVQTRIMICKSKCCHSSDQYSASQQPLNGAC
jgi:hypothetical protein